MLNTRTLAAASSNHMTWDDCNALAADATGGKPGDKTVLPVVALETGFLVETSQADDHAVLRLLSEKYSGEFLFLLLTAYTQGCHYLKLDADGPVYPGLPVFDW